MRDEKGKTLFSFHVIKYLLYLHISPTDDHSCLGEKKHYKSLLSWVLECHTILLAQAIFIRGFGSTALSKQTPAPPMNDRKRGKYVGGEEADNKQPRFLDSSLCVDIFVCEGT